MAEIVIPKVRQGSDITLRAKLTDNGVGVDWSGLENIVAMIYSDEQRVISGPCDVSIDPADNLYLVCEFGADRPQYGGINSLVVRCEYHGRKKTYDRKAFEIVSRTEDLEGEAIALEDPELTVELSVEDVSTSLLDRAIDAALAAAEAATEAAAQALEAAGKAPYIGGNGNWFVWNATTGEYEDTGTRARGEDGTNGKSPYIGENGNWFVWNDTTGAYVDTEVEAQGPQGERGKDGGILYPTFEVDAAMHLQMDTHEDTGADRFDLDAAGHLIVEI